MPQQEVHLLLYIHEYGTNITVHASRPGAEKAAAALARESWHEISGQAGVPPAPDGLTDAQVRHLYFSRHNVESYGIERHPVHRL
jgi:hypothetical protein